MSDEFSAPVISNHTIEMRSPIVFSQTNGLRISHKIHFNRLDLFGVCRAFLKNLLLAKRWGKFANKGKV